MTEKHDDFKFGDKLTLKTEIDSISVIFLEYETNSKKTCWVKSESMYNINDTKTHVKHLKRGWKGRSGDLK